MRRKWEEVPVLLQNYIFASASCREAFGTKQTRDPVSFPLTQPFPRAFCDGPPPPPRLEELQTDAVEGPACQKARTWLSWDVLGTPPWDPPGTLAGTPRGKRLQIYIYIYI